MLEVLSQDYIRTARAKGLGEGAILFLHALKNAAVPIVTVIGIGVALLIGGAVVTESVFAIPGLGRLTIDAIVRRDYPGHPGHRADVLVRLRDRQSVRRSHLHRARPEDPLLNAGQRTPPSQFLELRHSAGAARHPAAGARSAAACAASCAGTRRMAIGLAILLLIMLLDRRALRRCSAPAIRPRSRRPSATASPRPSSGSARTPSAGTSTPACSTAPASRWSSASRWRSLPRSPAWRSASSRAIVRCDRRHHHARHGRRDVDPAHPARHGADGADAGQRGERDPGDHHRRDPARRRASCAAWCCRCASSPTSMRRSPPARRTPAHHLAAHPAQHDGALSPCRRPTSAPRP